MRAKRMLYLYGVYAVLGVALVALSYAGVIPKTVGDFAASFGWVLLCIGVLKFLRIRAIAGDEEKAREYDARQTEERSIFITRKAKSIVFISRL